MLSPEQLDLIASDVRLAQAQRSRLQPITGEVPRFGLDDAYAVAARVHAQHIASDAVPRGRKIGFTNANIWPEYGVNQPIWGWVYAHTLVHAQDGSASLPADRFVEPKIEPEIAFGLSATPPKGASAADVARCIEWVAPAFEVVQSHYPGWKFKVADTIADGGLHGALVLGDRVPLSALGSDPAGTLAALQVVLARDGKDIETGSGANVLGSPVSALAHLVQIVAGRPDVDLKTGEVVTTGTVTAAYAVERGQAWTMTPRHAALKALTLRFE
jgi:2-oxo-3-hexenedioate decarboxylase